MTQFDVAYVRTQFPALRRVIDGRPVAYLDAPGGTQTPQRVLDAVERVPGRPQRQHPRLLRHQRRDRRHHRRGPPRDRRLPRLRLGRGQLRRQHDDAHLPSRRGARMRQLKPGDEVVITALDHEANRGPWLQARGARRRRPRSARGPRPRARSTGRRSRRSSAPAAPSVIALGYASNAVGTVNDVARAARLARDAGAWSVVDAVHYALHGPIDVRAVGCDFLLCSAYKFFGPHVGLMYARREATAQVEPLRLAPRTQTRRSSGRPARSNHEGLAGTTAAIDFIADLGARHLALRRRPPAGRPRRAGAARSSPACSPRRPTSSRSRRDCASSSPPSPASRSTGRRRAARARPPSPSRSTVSLAEQACRALGDRGLFVWDGDFYAARLVELLGPARDAAA